MQTIAQNETAVNSSVTTDAHVAAYLVAQGVTVRLAPDPCVPTWFRFQYPKDADRHVAAYESGVVVEARRYARAVTAVSGMMRAARRNGGRA